MTASISLRGVSQRSGVTWALTDIDLDLVPGVTGLLGPNGAGKTTLRWLFATVLAPTQGRVSVLGLDPAVPAQRTDIRRRLGYLPQEIGFPRGFSGFAFVDYVAVLKEWAQPAAATRKYAGCWTRSACPVTRASGSAPCPAVRAGGWRWPRRGPSSPKP